MVKYMPCVALLLVLGVFMLLLAGCNTMNGFGKDLQSWTADEAYGHDRADIQRKQELNRLYGK